MNDIEINEDNCVLDDHDLKIIAHAFQDYVEMNNVDRKARNEAIKEACCLFQKIKKLNEIVKEKQNGRG